MFRYTDMHTGINTVYYHNSISSQYSVVRPGCVTDKHIFEVTIHFFIYKKNITISLQVF